MTRVVKCLFTVDGMADASFRVYKLSPTYKRWRRIRLVVGLLFTAFWILAVGIQAVAWITSSKTIYSPFKIFMLSLFPVLLAILLYSDYFTIRRMRKYIKDVLREADGVPAELKIDDQGISISTQFVVESSTNIAWSKITDVKFGEAEIELGNSRDFLLIVRRSYFDSASEWETWIQDIEVYTADAIRLTETKNGKPT
ncbi:MAG: hypothetical protein F9K24_00685 [Leptonema illini]|uniref:YcxB-like protein domain-containing protein n=1 Tax=Leptonema illini TaxID=183 RepID=A0A833H4L9_9LEPT|nr:MAG: hypothetical protein F9K24_00685 [Leptonema illini]